MELSSMADYTPSIPSMEPVLMICSWTRRDMEGKASATQVESIRFTDARQENILVMERRWHR